MELQLYNSLTRDVQAFKPIDNNTVRIYSCGPTVYDRAHIGNLASFIYADTLRRTVQAAGLKVQHIMNLTDVDDKTIARSKQDYPDLDPMEALLTLTRSYEDSFKEDLRAVGVDVAAITFVRATDSIVEMQALIAKLVESKIAYISDDGIYFSISAYKNRGKTYGQLIEITAESTGAARVNNDEYDKDNVHDFALWKLQKDGEPAWDFDINGQALRGRPGWHIECSAMSESALGIPFDIHTGGVDLKFPHHENEIAQSTASSEQDVMAKLFFHSEHVLIDNKKMSKSLNNFFTLEDISQKKYDPLAFRLMILQAHYRNQTNFSWENLDAAVNRLQSYRAMADMRWQPVNNGTTEAAYITKTQHALWTAFQNDLNTPEALAILSGAETTIDNGGNTPECQEALLGFLNWLDSILGLQLASRANISDNQKQLLAKRQTARDAQDWTQSDEIRDQLAGQGITIRDTAFGQIWTRT